MSRTFRNHNNWRETIIISSSGRIFGWYWNFAYGKKIELEDYPSDYDLFQSWKALHGEGSKASWNSMHTSTRKLSRKKHRNNENMKIKNMKTLDDYIPLCKFEKIKY